MQIALLREFNLFHCTFFALTDSKWLTPQPCCWWCHRS